MENIQTPFTVGHHDVDRPLPITYEAVASAHASGYDVLTSPITTPHFHSRVLALLSNAFSDTSTSLNDITSSLNASPIVIPALAPVDTPLTPDETISQLVGVTSSWIDLESPDPIIADVSRQVLQLELAYAAFCGLSYVIIHGPRIRGNDAGGSGIVQYARAILDALGQGPFMSIYIWLPMIDHSENQKERMGDLAHLARPEFMDGDREDVKKLDLFGTWEAWDVIRGICRYSTRLSVALSLPKLLPPTPIQSRWFSEPVRILTVDSDVFVKNPKGYPVLSKAHQALIFRFVHTKLPAAWFLLCNVGPVPRSDATFQPSDPNAFPSLTEANNTPHIKDPTPHLSYMRNLQGKVPIKSQVELFGAGYQDYLQAPLQPLTVNLESVTYEVFEKDPIKYEWYERAVARALHDWIEQGKPTSNPDGRVVVAVVGAGRGPLVTRALQASEAVGVEIDMWALEKNPNAFVLLQRHNETIWDGKVNLVKSDMRTWRGPNRPPSSSPVQKIYNFDFDGEEEEEEEEDGKDASTPEQDTTHTTSINTDLVSTYPGFTDTDATATVAADTTKTTASKSNPTTYKIDILISELLGSFGDNELSPECLDGVQHLLNPLHGISVPASYTAHITPIAAPKLHADISLNMVHTIPNAAEVPYVVMLNAIDFLSTTEKSTTPAHDASKPSPPTTNNDTTTHESHSKPKSTTHFHPFSIAPHPNPIIHETWAFHHPNPSLPSPTSSLKSSSNTHNTRHSLTHFPIPHRGTSHGIAGYFESVLYRGVDLSTNPATMAAKSNDMISWFPIFFPFKTPLPLPDNSTVAIQMWRRSDDRKVWYEWIADVFLSVNGKNVHVGGSGLHSSEKEACLM